MGKEDFESEFEDIINNNDFSKVEIHEQEELEIALEEVAHILECMNETSMIIASAISEALETKSAFSLPQAAISILNALHALNEEFVSVVTTECDCEDCVEEEPEDE
jgi:hypothetical protein